MQNARTSYVLTGPTTRRRLLSLLLWLLQVLLAFSFVGGGWLKISGAPVMVEMFAAIGAGQWLRLVVGALEMAGAVGLLLPRLAGLAALGLCILLVGAIATNLFILNADSGFAAGLLVTSAIIAWARWGTTKQLFGWQPR